MIKRLPPLNFVKVFECAARHLNLHRAAEELGVTPGAVSQQIRALETNLGVPLFERLHKKLRLTVAGQQLFATSSQVLQMLQETVDRLPSPRQMVRITAAPTLCTRWLVPRLSNFYERHPNVGVLIDASIQYINLADEPFDVAIRHGRNGTNNAHYEVMFPDEVVAVCAPSIASSVSTDMSTAKLLCFAAHDHWPCWFSAKGLTGYNKLDRVSFSHLMLALDAAIAGQGVALGPLQLVEHDLRQGRLVRVHGDPVVTGFSYYVVARREARHVAAFTDWIIEEAAKDIELAGQMSWD
ncbi:MAG: LysR substrate-binding domain-containing protein [Afipia sp.]|nr:LysR substrate-binding domain-containing protein [Afipia sp.]